jgi:cell division septation protein DedD
LKNKIEARVKKLFLTSSLIIVINFLFGCSTLQQGNDNEKQVYIFDEVPEEKTIEAPKTGEYPNLNNAYYVVQIGAYTTEDKAQSFAQIGRTKTNYKCSVVYSDNLKLYLVQIIPFFKNREEAEQVRDNLKQLADFYDVWILTVNK